MKKVLLLLAVITSLTTNAQWKQGSYVDEFGDKTGDTFMFMRAVGTFSNSATQNSKCIYGFYDSDNDMIVEVKEYGSSMATSINPTTEIVKIKTPSGEVKTLKNVFFSKSGSLVFMNKNYTQLKYILTEKGRYVMVFRRSGRYSSSSYKVIFNIE
jgi:hypothetical protein